MLSTFEKKALDRLKKAVPKRFQSRGGTVKILENHQGDHFQGFVCMKDSVFALKKKKKLHSRLTQTFVQAFCSVKLSTGHTASTKLVIYWIEPEPKTYWHEIDVW